LGNGKYSPILAATGFPMSMPVAVVGQYPWKPIHSSHRKSATGSLNLKLKAESYFSGIDKHQHYCNIIDALE
jgi:hypothetical protein